MIPLPNPLSHAYLISGGAGDSRAALARRLTAAYLCQGSNPPCGTCRACRKAAADAHPDVSLTAPLQGKQEISVEQIRALRSDVYVRPNEGARKVYVIHPADVMNPSAQNALLKVLEEGPAYAAFLLLAGEPGRLLSRPSPTRTPSGMRRSWPSCSSPETSWPWPRPWWSWSCPSPRPTSSTPYWPPRRSRCPAA